MFVFTEHNSYNIEQVESIIGHPLILPEYMSIHYSVASAKDLFVFQMNFIATREGVVVGIETGLDKYENPLYGIYEWHIQRHLCGWWVNGGDVWELGSHGERKDVVMELARIVDNWGKIKTVRHRMSEKDFARYKFSAIFTRQIQIDELLKSL